MWIAVGVRVVEGVDELAQRVIGDEGGGSESNPVHQSAEPGDNVRRNLGG